MDKLKVEGHQKITFCIRELIDNLVFLSGKRKNIDLTGIRQLSPLSILPLATTITNKAELQATKFAFPKTEMGKALKSVCFPSGSEAIRMSPIPNTALINRFNITDIDISINDYKAEILNCLVGKRKNRASITQALMFFIAEMAANTKEHSKTSEFWIYSKLTGRDTLEICLLDRGIGFKRSYQNAGFSLANDVEALDKALKGVSTKEKSGNAGRGFGLRSGVNLIVKSALKGELVIISGKAGYYGKYGKDPKYFDVPDYSWSGVIISAVVELPPSPINIYDYLE